MSIWLKAERLKYLRFSDVVNDDENLKNDFDLVWLRKYILPFSWGEDIKNVYGWKEHTHTVACWIQLAFSLCKLWARKKWIFYPANNMNLSWMPRTERTFHFYSNANPYNKQDPDFPLT
jgi:hypothetical protein